MPNCPYLGAPRARRLLRLIGAALLPVVLVACSSTTQPSGSLPAATPSGMTPAPTPTPTPTPQPTPDYSSHPDATLEALIPDTVDGATVVKPDPTGYGVSPGDMGTAAFGDVGLRFESLVIAYIVKPRLSLYAVRVAPPPVDTADLRPYLVKAGRYIGASNLDPALWKATSVDGKQVWMRGEDEATLPGTTFYCWSSGEYVFLLTGSSDATNRAMIAALPGQPAPTPSPSASAAPGGSAATSSSPASSATATPAS